MEVACEAQKFIPIWKKYPTKLFYVAKIHVGKRNFGPSPTGQGQLDTLKLLLVSRVRVPQETQQDPHLISGSRVWSSRGLLGRGLVGSDQKLQDKNHQAERARITRLRLYKPQKVPGPGERYQDAERDERVLEAKGRLAQLLRLARGVPGPLLEHWKRAVRVSESVFRCSA